MTIAILIFVLIIVGIAWGNQAKLDELLEKIDELLEKIDKLMKND